jgi:hypothetical protein
MLAMLPGPGVLTCKRVIIEVGLGDSASLRSEANGISIDLPVAIHDAR